MKAIVKWIQSRLGPINNLPSWLDELVSGLLCVLVASLLIKLASRITKRKIPRWVIYPLAIILSEVYERVLDPWNYNPQDVVERVRGIALAIIIVESWQQ